MDNSTLSAALWITLALLVLGVTAARTSRRFRFSGTTLVLRRFKVNRTPGSDIAVEIAGRASGIVAWLLTSLGVDTEHIFALGRRQLSFRQAGVMGQVDSVVPLSQISSTHCGYHRPIGYLIFGVLFACAALISMFAARESLSSFVAPMLIVAVAFFVAYALSKKMQIAAETCGGLILAIRFKRSVIENVSIGMEQALEVISILDGRVVGSRGSPVETGLVNSFETARGALARCPVCSAEIESQANFCDNCGARIG